MKVLFLATDAYGGRGGIAYYNRCLAEALVEMPEVEQVTILPRAIAGEPAGIPEKVSFETQAAGSKLRYVLEAFRKLFDTFDLVVCGHIHLLPIAVALSAAKQVPLVLQVHGIDVWTRPRVPLLDVCLTRVTSVWSVSQFTRDRMNTWARLPVDRFVVIPNTIHLDRYGVAPKRPDLLLRYGLTDRKVILTLARLDSSERYKGIDEVLDVLPGLLQIEPTLCYVIAGSGNDQTRMAEKARNLRLDDHVIFTGYVADEDKVDLLGLADAFVMPGRGEGFGIVYLEAMACGVPVVGSSIDGSAEALKQGELGRLVNPDDPNSLVLGVLSALRAPKQIPPGILDFAWPMFSQKVATAVRRHLD